MLVFIARLFSMNSLETDTIDFIAHKSIDVSLSQSNKLQLLAWK